ncbi:MAG: ATP phosphoribosyltransferase regulatory subunit, partial [Actinomyces sp.]|nr:ATP phosphoribosyltransferase regulatory subunit [Actinomyces sp.]
LELVKPQRDALNVSNSAGRQRKKFWWLYGSDAKSLYHAIGRGCSFFQHPQSWDAGHKLSRVLTVARVSKTLAFAFSDPATVFSDQLVVFAFETGSQFSVVQSNIHAAFAWQHSSKLKNDLRYSPTDAFETFPLPLANGTLSDLGERFHQARIDVMQADRIGLTKLYNRFHTETERDPRIEGLRALQREMDTAVARAYGWDDLDLQHGFHEVPYLPENDRVRFTISESARVEVLRRLSELNRQRYEEEVAQGMHGGNGSQRASIRAPRANRATVTQSALDFEISTATSAKGRKSATAILGFLRAHDGWHAKADILAATGIAGSQWTPAINELITCGKVERQGERRDARYCIQPDNRNDIHEEM